uniref:Exostosin GT47 domain-containing protein n=1 Tax=Kalanchoe fedtschenkoi TaxID=63787 RepID=A0A7N0TCQ2_KALFE
MLECGIGRSDCHNPSRLMKMYRSSNFCLQPPGDSFTRRSTCDSILAGCIPVFFHPGSAYVQYMWHLPKNYNKYSVFIPMQRVKAGNVSIEEELMKIPARRVIMMREEVIKLIPKVIYADPRSKLETVEDAFDITVKAVLNRVEKMRERMLQGKDAMGGEPDEEVTWKYNMFGVIGNHDWDHFFLRTDVKDRNQPQGSMSREIPL